MFLCTLLYKAFFEDLKRCILLCTTIHRYPIFSTRYSVMCKVYTGYCGTSEIKHGLCSCTVDNPLAKARDYLSVQAHKPCSISHLLPNKLFVLYCIVLYCIVLYCIVLYCIVLYCIVLYCIVLYCIVLYCIVLYCISLQKIFQTSKFFRVFKN